MQLVIQGKRNLRLVKPSPEQRPLLGSVPTVGYGAANPYAKYGSGKNSDFTFPPSLLMARKLVGEHGATPDERTALWMTQQANVQALARKAAQDTREIASFPELLPFQRSGARFLRVCKRVLLGDDTGLGKTVMSLVASQRILREGGNVLILTVKGLIPQWRHEIERWKIEVPGGIIDLGKAQGRKDKFVQASRVKGAIVLMNWDALVTLRQYLSTTHWSIVIGDEAHFVKNRKAQRSAAMMTLCKNADYVWLMTGTPLEKSPADLWSLLHMLDPETFSSYWAFWGAFVDAYTDFRGNVVVKGAKNTPVLHDLMQRMYLRRLRADELKDVKEPQHIHLEVELTKGERKVYDQIEEGAFIDSVTVDGHQQTIEEWMGSTTTVGRLIHARQAAIAPGTIIPEFGIQSSKLDALEGLLQSFGDTDRVVIFTSFRAPCDLIKERLGEQAVVYLADRSPVLYQTFSRGEGPRFLVTTPFSLGVGANLQVARAIVFVDCPWSYTQYRQACARIVRIGQVYEALIYHLHAKDTVDDAIHEMLLAKADTFNEVAVARRVIDRLQQKYGYRTVGAHPSN